MGFKIFLRSRWTIFYLALVPALGAAMPAAAIETHYKLQGKVVNSTTGQPISRCLVQIGEPVQQSLLTGPDGNFAFADVPPGQTILKARKPGHLDNELGKPIWSHQVEVGPGTRLITIQLVPEIVIEGHIETAGDGPSRYVSAWYRVLQVRIESGRKKLEKVAEGLSDQDGNFRAANLPPGSYYVAVQPDWFARPEYATNNPRIEDAIVTPVDGIRANTISSDLTVSPAVYYPSNSNLSSASPVTLVTGKRSLTFSVKRQTTYKISGTISAPGGYIGIQIFDEFGQNLPDPLTGTYSGKFTVTLPAGKYILRAYHQTPPLISEIPVTVASDLPDFSMALVPTMSLPVVVRTEFTQKATATKPDANFQWVTVRLHPLDVHHQDEFFQRFFNIAMSDPLQIRDVAPGRYALEVLLNSQKVYVDSARCGGMDLLRQELVVPSAGQLPPIEIVVRDDGGVVAGTMKGPIGPSAKLLIAPQFAPMQLPAIVDVDEQGGFRSPELAPGEYTVLGFDSLKNVEYANPEALDGYRARAVHVKVLPQGSVNITVQANRVLDEKPAAIASQDK